MSLTCLAAALLLSPTKPKTTVIMIHGAGGGGWEYYKWVPIFKKAGFVVVNRDLVPTKSGLAKTRFDDYVRQVVSWSRPTHGPVVLVGASMGGILALKAAETIHPTAVVLVNSVSPAAIKQPENRPPVPEVMRWANGPLKDTTDAMPDSDQATILYAWKRWRDESGGVMNAIRTGIPVQVPHCPALTVIGSKDTDVAPAQSLKLADWAHADVHMYRGMSHVGPLMSTRATEVAKAIIQWLKRG